MAQTISGRFTTKSRGAPAFAVVLAAGAAAALLVAAAAAGAAPTGDLLAPLRESPFWASEALKVLALYGVACITGTLVRRYHVRVNYTRKINHFALFFVPIFLSGAFVYQSTWVSSAVSGLIFLGVLGTYVEPIRERVRIVSLMFASFDRPEDRPHTLLWLSTQTLAGYLVLIPLLIAFDRLGIAELIFLPILINAVGDGLAEPVGVRFGRHPYRVKALFTDRAYTRTLEGSACVLLSGIGMVLLFAGYFSGPQLIAALLIVPLAMTLAEAFSPHTWDTPFLFLAGGLATLGIVMLV